MNLKNKISFIVLAIINLCVTLLLTIFVLPCQIPFGFDFNEKIISLVPKWIMLIASIIPTIFIIISLLTKSKKTQFCLQMLFIWSLFENILYFSYFSVGKKLSIGDISEVPISVSVFMPISVILTVLAVKLKRQPYLSKLAINFKITRETEFIWKQTHIYASDVYFITGLILFLVSVIFSLLRLPLIELAIFLILILICSIIVYVHSKSIYNKYMQMKTRQDKLKNKHKENVDNTDENSINNIEKTANFSKNNSNNAQNTKKIKKNKKINNKIDGSNLM